MSVSFDYSLLIILGIIFLAMIIIMAMALIIHCLRKPSGTKRNYEVEKSTIKSNNDAEKVLDKEYEETCVFCGTKDGLSFTLNTEHCIVEVIELSQTEECNCKHPFGFCYATTNEGKGVKIVKIIPNTTAHRDGRLLVGDYIIRVGNTHISGKKGLKEEIIEKECGGSSVRLVVARPLLKERNVTIIRTNLLGNEKGLDKCLTQKK